MASAHVRARTPRLAAVPPAAPTDNSQVTVASTPVRATITSVSATPFPAVVPGQPPAPSVAIVATANPGDGGEVPPIQEMPPFHPHTPCLPTDDTVYPVSIRLENSTLKGESEYHIEMRASAIHALLTGNLPFVRLSARYEREPLHEAIYVAATYIAEVFVGGNWPG